jgi:hypothetical protein
MRIFFDTEFYENGKTIELISIGAVREDGATYYAEVLNARELCFQSDWLVQNVLPHLRMTPEVTRSRGQIAQELLEFVGKKPEFWAYHASYDWVVLCQLYGRMIDLPKDWETYCNDLKQWRVENGNPAVIKLPETAAHNALGDAQWLAKEFQRLGAGSRT